MAQLSLPRDNRVTIVGMVAMMVLFTLLAFLFFSLARSSGAY